MQRGIPVIVAVSALLLAGPPAQAQKTIDPIGMIRKTLKYWYKVYDTYREEVVLGYCWADYFLGIEESVPNREQANSLNSTSVRFDGSQDKGGVWSAGNEETYHGRRNSRRYKRNYRLAPDYRSLGSILVLDRNYTRGTGDDSGTRELLDHLVRAALRGFRKVFKGRLAPGDGQAGANWSGMKYEREDNHSRDKFLPNESSGTVVDKTGKSNDPPGVSKSGNYREQAFRKSAGEITRVRSVRVENDPAVDTCPCSSSSRAPREKHPPYGGPLSRRKDAGPFRTVSGPKFPGNGAEDDRKVRPSPGEEEEEEEQEDTRRKVLYSMMRTGSAAAVGADARPRRTFSLKGPAAWQILFDNRRFSDRAGAPANDQPFQHRWTRRKAPVLSSDKAGNASALKSSEYRKGAEEGSRAKHNASRTVHTDYVSSGNKSLISPLKPEGYDQAAEENLRNRRDATLVNHSDAILGPVPGIDEGEKVSGDLSVTQSNLGQFLRNGPPRNVKTFNSTSYEFLSDYQANPQLEDSRVKGESANGVNSKIGQSSELPRALLNSTTQDKESREDYGTKPQLDIPEGVDWAETDPRTEQSLDRLEMTLSPVTKNLQVKSTVDEFAINFGDRANLKKQRFKHPETPSNSLTNEKDRPEENNETEAALKTSNLDRRQSKPEQSGKKRKRPESPWRNQEPLYGSGYPMIERWLDYKAKTRTNPQGVAERTTDSQARSKQLRQSTAANNRLEDSANGGTLGLESLGGNWDRNKGEAIAGKEIKETVQRERMAKEMAKKEEEEEKKEEKEEKIQKDNKEEEEEEKEKGKRKEEKQKDNMEEEKEEEEEKKKQKNNKEAGRKGKMEQEEDKEKERKEQEGYTEEKKEEEEGNPRGDSSLPGARRQRFMTDYDGPTGGTSLTRSTGNRDQGRRSWNIVRAATGSGRALTPLLDPRATFMAALRTLGLFVHVGRQIMEYVEGNKLLSCTTEYIWNKFLEWIES